MKCKTCQWSRVKTDPDLNMKRFCMYAVPTAVTMAHPRGLVQVTPRAEVDDDDFCSQYKEKDANSTTEVSSPGPTIVID